DELQAGGVDIAPVDDYAGGAHPADTGIAGDAEPLAVQDDGPWVVVGDGVAGLFVLQDHDGVGPVLPAVQVFDAAGQVTHSGELGAQGWVENCDLDQVGW